METSRAAEYATEVSITGENDSEPARTPSLLSLILALYRAAQETPVAEFPLLALAMVRALSLEQRSDRAVVASHIGNAIRINRTVCPVDCATDEQGGELGHTR